jgi:hypothetical protein
MHAVRTLTVWACLLIVALPLSPCAFFSSSCCNHETGLATQAAGLSTAEACQSPARGCCAHHDASHPAGAHQRDDSQRSAPQPGERPCKTECCLLSPFVPQLAKVAFDAQPLAVAVALPQPATIFASPFEAASLPLAPDPSLQILHCQWRL